MTNFPIALPDDEHDEHFDLLSGFDVEGPKRVVEAFLRDKNPNTLLAYQRDLESFAEWVGAPGNAELAIGSFFKRSLPGANAAALEWKHYLVSQGLAAGTINRRLAALRSIVSLARSIGAVQWPDKLAVKNVPSKSYRDTSGPGLDGYLDLIKILDGRNDTAPRRRDKAIVTLLFELALRRHEVAQLDISDVEFERSRIRILGKGRSETEYVTMPDGVAAVLESWLDRRGTSEGPLFISYDPTGKGDGRLTLRSITRLVKNLGKLAGNNALPHGLRHASITAALDDNKGDVRKVKRFSRHAKADTLLIYDDNREDHGGQVAGGLQNVLERRREEIKKEDLNPDSK